MEEGFHTYSEAGRFRETTRNNSKNRFVPLRGDLVDRFQAFAEKAHASPPSQRYQIPDSNPRRPYPENSRQGCLRSGLLAAFFARR
jgi:hypothetical protein